MISVDEAQEKILSQLEVLEEEEVPILDCLGRVLAEDIYSSMTIPPLDNSAMDGYAVRAQDTKGASQQSPRFLSVVGISVPGSTPKGEVRLGTAMRIMTGAPIPKGADSIVRFEDTDEARRRRASTEIGILREVECGFDIRRAGEDITQGSLVLARGVVIRSSEVGVLASLGRSVVKVIRRPIVAILATGDEVVDIKQPLPPGKIYNSNTYSLAAMVLHYGGIPRILGVASDSEDSVVSSLHTGLEADMLLTTGGVSLGDYDVVKDVLVKQGDMTFWAVRMKPGKPLVFGMIKRPDKISNIPHLGLPGNPVSTMVTFELFARPAILKMMGKKNWAKPMIEAIIEEPIMNQDGRRIFARAVVEKRDGQYFARLTGPQGSGILTSMTSANGLIIVPEDKAGVEPGDVVQVMMLDWSEEV